MQQTVLILGARGRFGLAAAQAFADRGWNVLAQIRPNAAVPAEGHPAKRIRWIAADLNDVDALVMQAQGAHVVVNALNPAYTTAAWRAQGLPLMEAALAVTRALQATLMFPGNVYNFGDGMPGVLHEDTPQLAQTVMGKVRVAMESCVKESGVRAVVIRAGNFFGAGTGAVFDQVIVKNIRKGDLTYLGERNVLGAWAYVPDLARAFVAVAQQRAVLPRFEVLHFAGHSLTGQDWLSALTPIARMQQWVREASPLKFKQLPWPVIRIGALVVPTWAALLPLRYLWQTAHTLDNTKLVGLIGAEPHTQLEEAATATLRQLGYLDSRNRVPPSSITSPRKES
jgi:nucleoside-diphosphate-sugar epimerase